MGWICASKNRAGVFGLVCVLGVSALMGGCSSSKKDAERAQQEAAELRERVAALDEQNRNKDAQIADLNTRLANAQQQQQQPQFNQQAGGGWDSGRSGGASENFQRNSEGNLVAEIAGNVLFASGQATVQADARRKLDSIASEIRRRYPGAAIRVEGHTDSDKITKSKWPSNEALSQARAEAVMSYLRTKGVNNQMNAVGYGSSQPKATKAASRRVEIVILN